MRKTLSIVLIVLTVFLAVVFAVLNSAIVTIDLFVASFTAPLSVIAMLSVVVGFLLGILATGRGMFRRYVTVRELRRRLALADDELEKLRKLPIKDNW